MKSKLVIVLGMIIAIYACKHEPLPLTSPPVDEDTRLELEPCNPDSVYFYNDIVPLFVSNCAFSGCHSPISLSNYNDIVNIGDVVPGDTSASYIYQVLITSNLAKRMPRPPRNPLQQNEIDLVAKWILQGAKENSCNDCDPNQYAFNANVRPIIQKNCVGCHGGTNPSGGVRLENYFQIKSQADNGKLIGSVEHQTGFSSMPPSGKLPECQITVLKKWIEDGAQNN